MARPTIGYLTMLTGNVTTIADPGSASGYPITNIKDLKSYSLWKSSVLTSPIQIDVDNGGVAQNADYVALVNHNLFTLGATLTVLADTFTPPTTVRLAAFTPGEDGVTLRTITAPGALRYWRFTITDPSPPFAVAPYIGNLFCGMRTDLPEYMDPGFEPYFDDVEVEGVSSRKGHFLGAVTRGHAHDGVIACGAAGAARADYTGGLKAFIDYANLRKPFVFVLDRDDTDFDDARYVRLRDDARIERVSVGGSWARLAYRIPVTAAYMEPAP